MVKRVPMEGGDESHPSPDEILKRRNAVGSKIMDHWREFGVALKGRNAGEMSRINGEIRPLQAEWNLHNQYLQPGQSSKPRGGGGSTPSQRLSPTAVEKSTPRRLGGGGGGGGGGTKLTDKKK
jgi:hypothetical protein